MLCLVTQIAHNSASLHATELIENNLGDVFNRKNLSQHLPQSTSSDASLQSLAPSHLSMRGMQLPSAQANWSERQAGEARKKAISRRKVMQRQEQENKQRAKHPVLVIEQRA